MQDSPWSTRFCGYKPYLKHPRTPKTAKEKYRRQFRNLQPRVDKVVFSTKKQNKKIEQRLNEIEAKRSYKQKLLQKINVASQLGLLTSVKHLLSDPVLKKWDREIRKIIVNKTREAAVSEEKIQLRKDRHARRKKESREKNIFINPFAFMIRGEAQLQHHYQMAQMRIGKFFETEPRQMENVEAFFARCDSNGEKDITEGIHNCFYLGLSESPSFVLEKYKTFLKHSISQDPQSAMPERLLKEVFYSSSRSNDELEDDLIKPQTYLERHKALYAAGKNSIASIPYSQLEKYGGNEGLGQHIPDALTSPLRKPLEMEVASRLRYLSRSRL